MLDVMGPDFTRTARAKGTTRTRALVKHGLRVALIPMSTYFAYSFGTLVAGSAFLEIVFSWSGMGQYGIQAVQTSDINAVTGNVLFSAVIILFASTLSVVLYASLDRGMRVIPRLHAFYSPARCVSGSAHGRRAPRGRQRRQPPQAVPRPHPAGLPQTDAQPELLHRRHLPHPHRRVRPARQHSEHLCPE